MIRVTVELLSAQNGERSVLGVMDIWNDGQSTNPRRGNYRGQIYRKGTKDARVWSRGGTIERTGGVNDYPRLSYPIWRLVIRMLKQMYPEER